MCFFAMFFDILRNTSILVNPFLLKHAPLDFTRLLAAFSGPVSEKMRPAMWELNGGGVSSSIIFFN